MKATDSNLDFDGMRGDGVNRGKNRFAGNHSGLTAVTNAGRGPTKGNNGTNTYAGAPTGATGTAQYRGIGGTQVKKPGADAKIDMKRGPTKGNCGC